MKEKPVRTALVKEYQYFDILEVVQPKPMKTKSYIIRNKTTGDILGYIGWYNRWRQYCMTMIKGVIWSKGCLNDLENFLTEIKEVRNEHK